MIPTLVCIAPAAYSIATATFCIALKKSSNTVRSFVRRSIANACPMRRHRATPRTVCRSSSKRSIRSRCRSKKATNSRRHPSTRWRTADCSARQPWRRLRTSRSRRSRSSTSEIRLSGSAAASKNRRRSTAAATRTRRAIETLWRRGTRIIRARTSRFRQPAMAKECPEGPSSTFSITRRNLGAAHVRNPSPTCWTWRRWSTSRKTHGVC